MKYFDMTKEPDGSVHFALHNPSEEKWEAWITKVEAAITSPETMSEAREHLNSRD